MTKIGVCVFAHMEKEAVDHRDSLDLMSLLSGKPTDKSHTIQTSAEDAAGARRVLRVPVDNKYYSADAMIWLFANYAQLNSWLDEGRPALTSAVKDGSQEEGEVLIFVARIDLKNVDDELMTNLRRAIRGPIAETQAILLKGSSEDYSEQYDRLQTFCTENRVELIETMPSKTTKETLSENNEKYGMDRFREVLFAVVWPCRQPKPNPCEQAKHRAYLSNQIASLEKEEVTAGHMAQPTETQSSPAKTAKTLINDEAQLEKKASSSSAMKTTVGHDGTQSEKEKAQSSSSSTVAKDAAASSGACLEKPHSSGATKAGVYLEWPPTCVVQAEILQAFGDILNDEQIFVQPSSNSNPSAQKPSTSSAPPAGDIILSPESAERLAQEARDATLPGDLFFMSMEPSLSAQLNSLAMSTEMMKKLDNVGLGMNIFTGKPLGRDQNPFVTNVNNFDEIFENCTKKPDTTYLWPKITSNNINSYNNNDVDDYHTLIAKSMENGGGEKCFTAEDGTSTGMKLTDILDSVLRENGRAVHLTFPGFSPSPADHHQQHITQTKSSKAPTSAEFGDSNDDDISSIIGRLSEMKQQGSKLERDERVAFAEKVSLSMLKKLNDAGGGSSSTDENLADQKTKDDDKKELDKDDENDAVVKEENSSKEEKDKRD